jgi:hypothetical protein
MGMSNSDDEERIHREHYALEEYKRLFPYSVPPSTASETERAMWEDEVLRRMGVRR